MCGQMCVVSHDFSFYYYVDNAGGVDMSHVAKILNDATVLFVKKHEMLL